MSIDHESEVDILTQKLNKLEKKFEKSEAKAIRLSNKNNELKMVFRIFIQYVIKCTYI